MPEVLVFPPHILRAKAALVGAGFAIEADGPAFAALMFATIAWERTPQFNAAAELRQRLAEAERENRRLMGELLREGTKVNRLLNQLAGRTQLRMPAPPMLAVAS